MSRERWQGAIVGAVLLLLIFVAFTGQVPLFGGESGTTVTARFAQANQLDDATPVRVGGVDVGHVSELLAAPGNTTDVKMLITTAGVTLHSDASAQIRWRTLLGGSMYVDVNSGSPTAPPLTGTIPLDHTGTQVDWRRCTCWDPPHRRSGRDRTRSEARRSAIFSGWWPAPRGLCVRSARTPVICSD
jgi:ABC-type transporter Mla subunit MlaD